MTSIVESDQVENVQNDLDAQVSACLNTVLESRFYAT